MTSVQALITILAIAAVRKPVRGQNRHRLPIMTSRPKKWKHSI